MITGDVIHLFLIVYYHGHRRQCVRWCMVGVTQPPIGELAALLTEGDDLTMVTVNQVGYSPENSSGPSLEAGRQGNSTWLCIVLCAQVGSYILLFSAAGRCYL